MNQPARGNIPGRAGPPSPSLKPSRARSRRLRSAFTLVELLVVMVVIGMLAGIVLGALGAARETNRAAKTRNTIAKLDKIIMAKYDSYRTRRIPLGRTEINTIATNLYGWTNAARPATAAARVSLIRDLMRMEMPDRWNDIVEGDTAGSQRNPLVYDPANFRTEVPALARRYWTAFHWARTTYGKDRATLEKWGPAECLYQIVMAIPGAADQFHESEIGDIDEDGLKEFHDGWGKPIMFIRWPAAFVPEYGGDSELQNLTIPDPFDPSNICPDRTVNPARPGWALYPLIFSAGPDGIYDISSGRSTGVGNVAGDPYYRYVLTPTFNQVSPYVRDADGNYVGFPIDADPADGRINATDNVHNHHHEVK